MTTAIRGVRYEFKRKNVGTGNIGTSTILSVPIGSSYFIYINQIYNRITSGSDKIQPSSTTYYINKDFTSVGIASSSGVLEFPGSDLFFRRGYLADANTDRILYPGEFLWLANYSIGSNILYIDYTEVYFGGLSESI